MIGVLREDGLIFERRSLPTAHLVWPTPVMIPAQLLSSSLDKFPALQFGTDPQYYFREDLFDPVSRIRRGRFYKTDGRRGPWSVFNDQYGRVIIPRTSVSPAGNVLEVPGVAGYNKFQLFQEIKTSEISNPVVMLGTNDATTIWSIVQVETGFYGEELVTLKSQRSLGALPEVDWQKIPVDAKGLIQEKLTVLEDDYLRAGAESVVDRAREAATAILSGFLQVNGVSEAKGEDLGALINLLTKQFGKNARRIVACAAEIPQRLHSRAKHAEQEKQDLRPVREQDAELAMQCIGVMLCDLGWAEWR